MAIRIFRKSKIITEMKKIDLKILFLILVIIFSNFSFGQVSKSQAVELKGTTEGFVKAETVKKVEENLIKALGAEHNSKAVSVALKKMWESAKGLNKQQAKLLFERFSSASGASLREFAKMSPSRFGSYVRDITHSVKLDSKTLKNIIYGAGDKAGNATLKIMSQIDNMLAETGTVSVDLLKRMKSEASYLDPERASAVYDLFKKKLSGDWAAIKDLSDTKNGLGKYVGTVVDGVFVLNDAVNIYYSDDDPEVKGIQATAKIIDYSSSTAAGVASSALGGGLGPGLVIAFSANRVSTLYTEIAMLQKEREDAENAEKNEKIDNGILVRRQLVNISKKIELGQIDNAVFLNIRLQKFLLKNNVENATKLLDLSKDLEEKTKDARRTEQINGILNKARSPYSKALYYYKRGVELDLAKIYTSEALAILNNNLRTYPEISKLRAIPNVKKLIRLINNKISNAKDLIITGTNAPEKVYTGQFLEIGVFVNGGIPYYHSGGSLTGNVSDDNVVTFYWQAPSKTGKEVLTFIIADCMGHQAKISKKIEVVEKTDEEDDEEFEGNNPLDGLWEIHPDSDVIITKLDTEDDKGTYEVSKFKELDKSNKTIWGDNVNIATDFVLKFFNSKNIYFKKIKNFENGFSYYYLYKYDEDTFEQIVLRVINKSNFEIFPIGEYEASNYRLLLSVKKNYMECLLEDISTSMSSYKYKFYRKNMPKNPPTLSNGSWTWNELEDDFKDELDIYSKLSPAEKNNFNLAKIEEDEDAFQTIQWKIAVFKKFQSQYNNFFSSYKGKRSSDLNKIDLIWDLVDVEYVNPGPILPYSATSSSKEGWTKIWKEKTENVEADNYIPPADSEEDPNIKRSKNKVFEFDWDLPEKQYVVGEKWNTNLRKFGNIKAVLQTLEDGNVISKNSVEFNSGRNTKEVIIKCKYFYNIQDDYEVNDEIRIVYKFELHVK